MIARLPRWVWGGAGVLAFNAGMINAVGLLGIEHQAITHLTGTTTLLGTAVATWKWSQALHYLSVVLAFLFGAMLSGFIIADSTLRLGRRYGFALWLEAALLCSAVPLLSGGHPLGDYLASCACGLQNAMASTFSGSVVRTTHLSGMFTDIGILLGHLLRRLPFDRLRLYLYTMIIGGFLTGGIVGGVCFRTFGYQTLFFPAALTGFAALSYTLYLFLDRR